MVRRQDLFQKMQRGHTKDRHYELTLAHHPAVFGPTAAVGEYMVQVIGRRLAQNPIQMGHLMAEQPLKVADGLPGIIIAEPPEPVRLVHVPAQDYLKRLGVTGIAAHAGG